MDLSKMTDNDILGEISRRFDEKSASIREMEFMTKKLLELNEQTKQAERVKGEFLSIIKNEFNNPLSSLLNFSDSLVRKKNPAKTDQLHRLIHMELMRLDFHFRNVFAATEIEAGEIANYYTIINLKELFEDVRKPLQYVIEERNLEIVFENRLETPTSTDSEKMYIILLNLLSNACEYSFPDSKINVTFKEDSDQVVLTVEDFGEGIQLDHHAKIFDRFAKFATGRTRAQTGLGLGLSIVRGMAEALEGTVDFESKEGWTVFTVILPKKPIDSAEAIENADTLLFDDFSDAVEI